MRLDAECIKRCTYEGVVSIEESTRQKEQPTSELKGRIEGYVVASIGWIVRGIVPGTPVRLFCVWLRFAAGACLTGTPLAGIRPI